MRVQAGAELPGEISSVDSAASDASPKSTPTSTFLERSCRASRGARGQPAWYQRGEHAMCQQPRRKSA